MDEIVPNAEDIARRDAVHFLANRAKSEALHYGKPSGNPIVETVGRRVETQAVSLLLEAAQSMMFPATEEWKLVEELRKLWRCPYTDREAQAEYWERIMELAEDAAEDAREDCDETPAFGGYNVAGGL